MVHKDHSKGPKRKPRGRPFPKGNKRGKLENDLLATPRHEISDERGVIAPSSQHKIPELIDEELEQSGITLRLEGKGADVVNKLLKESMDSTQEELKDDKKELELIESIEFKNGENTLTIRFSKKHNRMFRIQVFLNDVSEIRPVTYTGASTGYSFWNLLKGSLKK